MSDKKIISSDLFDDLVEYAIELKSEWGWMKDEPRNNLGSRYKQLQEIINEAVQIRDEPASIAPITRPAAAERNQKGNCSALPRGNGANSTIGPEPVSFWTLACGLFGPVIFATLVWFMFYGWELVK